MTIRRRSLVAGQSLAQELQQQGYLVADETTYYDERPLLRLENGDRIVVLLGEGRDLTIYLGVAAMYSLLDCELWMAWDTQDIRQGEDMAPHRQADWIRERWAEVAAVAELTPGEVEAELSSLQSLRTGWQYRKLAADPGTSVLVKYVFPGVFAALGLLVWLSGCFYRRLGAWA